MIEHYKKAYFTLFSAGCETIATLEKLLQEPQTPTAFLSIETEIRRIQNVQRETEAWIMEGNKK